MYACFFVSRSKKGVFRSTFFYFSDPFKISIMLRLAIIFFIIAIVAAVFGFGGIAAGAVGIAKILFWIFVVLFVISLLFGIVRRGRP